MMAQRYAIIHQKILRHQLFLPTHVSGDSTRRSNVRHRLTPIESLLGNNGVNNTVLLLAVLLQIEEGQYYLEDPSGQVPAYFRDTVIVDGFFVTEHCILLVEGSFHDGIFYVDRLGHPFPEKRQVSLNAIRQQVSHPFYSSKISYD
jgi:DNA polymerase epsilon subunit 2